MDINIEKENSVKNSYQNIKELVINYGIPPGERINIEKLAEHFCVSTTPVRESLKRLVAEELILMIPGVGFFMKNFDEAELRDLYEFNRVLLDWSIVHIRKDNLKKMVSTYSRISTTIKKMCAMENLDAEVMVKKTNEIFLYLASQTGNREIILRVRNINDRLYYLRINECKVLEDPVKHFIPLIDLSDKDNYNDLRKAFSAYHKERLKLLSHVLNSQVYSANDMCESLDVQLSLSH